MSAPGFDLLARLQDCKEMAQLLHGESYQDAIRPYKEDINKKRVLMNKGILLTVAEICADPVVDANGQQGIMYMAAALDMFENME